MASECNNPDADFNYTTIHKTTIHSLALAIESKTGIPLADEDDCASFTPAVESIQVDRDCTQCSIDLNQCQTEKAELEAQLAQCIADCGAGDCTDCESNLATCVSDKATLQGNLNTCLSQKSQLEADLVTANNRITELEADLQACQDAGGDCSVCEADLQTCIDEKAQLQTDLDTANATITTLQADLVTANVTITDRDATIVTLNETIATRDATILDLQQQLDECENPTISYTLIELDTNLTTPSQSTLQSLYDGQAGDAPDTVPQEVMDAVNGDGTYKLYLGKTVWWYKAGGGDWVSSDPTDFGADVSVVWTVREA